MKLRIVINTYGSAGDLNPFLAIARGLQSRGHHVLIASSEISRAAIEAAGVEYRHVRRAFIYGHETPDKLLTHNISNSYDELMKVVDRADLLITHQLSFAGPLVAASTGVPWVSVAIYPLTFASDNQLLPFAGHSSDQQFTPKAYELYLSHVSQMRLASQIFTKQVARLRASLGLPRGKNVLFADHNSPELILAAFSSAFASPDRDWPAATVITGFPFDDQLTAGAGMTPALEQFLREGTPPIVFTLGSAAAFDNGMFWIQSIGAAKILGRRAVLVGSDLRFPSADDVICVEHAPYAELLPRCVALVHHGGIGTIAAGLRAGCPMLVLPGESSCDLSENAARVAGLGVGRVLTLGEYNAFSAAAELALLLKHPTYSERATALSRVIESENGVEAACDAIENYLIRHEGAEVTRQAV